MQGQFVNCPYETPTSSFVGAGLKPAHRTEKDKKIDRMGEPW